MTIENAIKRNVTKNLNERARETRIENVIDEHRWFKAQAQTLQACL